MSRGEGEAALDGKGMTARVGVRMRMKVLG